MIYEEDRTVDEMVDDILGTGDEGVRERNTKSSGGGTVAKQAAVTPQEERVACRRCGKLFTRRAGSGRTMCEECFRMSHARVRKQPPANDRKIKPEDEVQRAWDALGTEAVVLHPNDEPKIGDTLPPMAVGIEHDRGDMILNLYEDLRIAAKVMGVRTMSVIYAMYEIESTLTSIGNG